MEELKLNCIHEMYTCAILNQQIRYSILEEKYNELRGVVITESISDKIKSIKDWVIEKLKKIRDIIVGFFQKIKNIFKKKEEKQDSISDNLEKIKKEREEIEANNKRLEEIKKNNDENIKK